MAHGKSRKIGQEPLTSVGPGDNTSSFKGETSPKRRGVIMLSNRIVNVGVCVMFVFVAFLAVCSVGCSPSPKAKTDATPKPVTVRSNPSSYTECPYVFPKTVFTDTLELPGGTFIDYSDDFYSWHYKGRERGPTPEETILHVLDMNIAAAEQNGSTDNVINTLLDSHDYFANKFSPILENLATSDKARFDERVQMLAKASKETPVAGKDSPTASKK